MGAFHYVDLSFVFGRVPDSWGYVQSFTPAEQLVSDRMKTNWVNFAETTGNPNGLLTAQGISQIEQLWPQYSRSTDERMVLDAVSSLQVVSGAYQEACDLWDSHLFGPVPSSPGSSSSSGDGTHALYLAIASVVAIVVLSAVVVFLSLKVRAILQEIRQGNGGRFMTGYDEKTAPYGRQIQSVISTSSVASPAVTSHGGEPLPLSPRSNRR